jgi:hypothetical protein
MKCICGSEMVLTGRNPYTGFLGWETFKCTRCSQRKTFVYSLWDRNRVMSRYRMTIWAKRVGE